MNQEYRLSQVYELEHPIKFRYPILIRILLGIGGPGFLAGAVLTSPLVREQGLAVWVPLLFLVIGLLNVLVVYLFSGQIVIDSYAVSYQRLGRNVYIPFNEVLRIEHRGASDRLVIQGVNSRIIVEKQLKDYELFYSLLNKLCPNREPEARLSFPIEIHSRPWLPVFTVVISLIGFGNLYYAFQYTYIPVGIVGILGVIMGVVFFLTVPRRYIFKASGLTVISPIRKKIYPAETLLDLRFDRPFEKNSLANYSLLTLKYQDGTVMLRDLNVDFPVEVLAKLLFAHYPRLMYNTR